MPSCDDLVRAAEAYLAARQKMRDALKSACAPEIMQQFPTVYGYLKPRTISAADMETLSTAIRKTALPLAMLLRSQECHRFDYPERGVAFEFDGSRVLVLHIKKRMEALECS